MVAIVTEFCSAKLMVVDYRLLGSVCMYVCVYVYTSVTLLYIHIEALGSHVIQF